MSAKKKHSQVDVALMNKRQLSVRELSRVTGLSRAQLYGFINRKRDPLPAYNYGAQLTRVFWDEYVEWSRQNFRVNRTRPAMRLVEMPQ